MTLYNYLDTEQGMGSQDSAETKSYNRSVTWGKQLI